MGCRGNWPSPSQGKEPAGGAPAHWSRPLPSLCMHKLQHSGELGRLNFISYLTGRKVDVFFFTVFVAKPIHGAQPGPRRGARGDAGCGAYVDELGKGEASSSGSRCFSVSVGDSQHWEPISPTPKNQPSRGMSHQPSLTHQPSVHRFLSQHPRCINPTHLQSPARCSTSPKPLNGVHPGHTLQGAGVKWRTTRSRAGPSRQALLRLSGVQRQTASACLAFPCFVQAICRRQHAAFRRQHTVSWRLSSSTLTRQFPPYLFFSPSSRHHITVTPSPHTPSPPPSSPPLGSSDPSSLFFFPCSTKVETALHEFPVHPAASRGRCHRLYLSPLSRAAAPAEKDFDADEERTDVLTLSGLVRPQRPAVETGTRTKES